MSGPTYFPELDDRGHLVELIDAYWRSDTGPACVLVPPSGTRLLNIVWDPAA